MKPKVSVVMSVYNGGDYLSSALQSILDQSFSDFEFVIINDGSTDGSLTTLKKFAKKDKRINLIDQANAGLVASLNRGIEVARGQYIARQDADDKSNPSRLAKQVEFLDGHPLVVAVGSNISVMDESGKIIHQHAVLLQNPELQQELLVRSPFAHGSVMFRRQVALKVGLYDGSTWPAEDYDFWLRLSVHGRLANLDEALYIYREHSKSISEQNTDLQNDKSEEVRARAWQQRARLASSGKINLASYKDLVMGQVRIQRILANQLWITKKAASRGQLIFAFKVLFRLTSNPLAYKKLAGVLKRKLIR